MPRLAAAVCPLLLGTGNPRPHFGQVIRAPGAKVSSILRPTPHEGQASFFVSIHCPSYFIAIYLMTVGNLEMFNILSWTRARWKASFGAFRAPPYYGCQ